MATARDIVTRAMRKRRIIPVGVTPEASEMSDGVDDLNDMLAAWRINGIDIGHVTLVAADTLDVPDDHILTIVLSLAERMGDYGGQMDPADILLAEQGRRALQAQYFHIDTLSCEGAQSGLLMNDGQWPG